METATRKVIGRNIRIIREASGLSQINFALLTGLSRASIVNIESGKKGYNLDLLDKILAFSNYKIDDIIKNDFNPPYNLREILVKYHRNDLPNYTTLNETPTIVYAVKYRLLKTKFLDTPKEINEIRSFFEQFGWYYLGTSIQNALKRMPELILVEKHPVKQNTFTYVRRQ